MERKIDRHYWIDKKCENCGNIESVPGPKREDMEWQEFSMLVRTSSEVNPHYKFCTSCRKMARMVVVSYDSE